MALGSTPYEHDIVRLRKAMHDPSGSSVSVIVGAGFSRNSKPVSNPAKPFPNWATLAEQLARELYPSSAQSQQLEDARRSAASTSGALRLAKEYEVAFGPPALKDFVRRAIPDADNEPGDLHRQLLELNWADVFTTNYDTLLERQYVDIVKPRYTIVRSPGDLPLSHRPRIVKLHGTLPELNHLVLTEDDYREYPVKYAPFVSEVQVALMETHLCLIGFSGDDPNFLAWTGWVRDQLRSNIPYLYFFTFDDLPTFRRRLLEDRRIIPLHLPTLFGNDCSPSELLRKLFDELARPLDPQRPEWNRFTSEEDDEPNHGLPPDAGDTPDSWLRRAKLWRDERLNYLGWLVPHRAAIEGLWEATEAWALKPKPELSKALGTPAAVFVLWELAWRCRTALFPLYDAIVETVVLPLLDEFDWWFESSVTETSSCELDPQTVPLKAGETEVEIPTVDLVRAALELRLETIRHAREIGHLARFWSLVQKLEQDLDLNSHSTDSSADRTARLRLRLWDVSNAQHFVCYQKTLAQLSNLNDVAASELVRAWETDGSPVWSMRKAGLLAELGDGDGARVLWRKTLREVKRRVAFREATVLELSCEGWLTWFLKRTKGAERYRRPAKTTPSTQVESSVSESSSTGRSISIAVLDEAQRERGNVPRKVLDPPAQPSSSKSKENDPQGLAKRLRELRKQDCDPEKLIEWLNDENARGFNATRESEVIGFDPSSRTTSYSSGDAAFGKRCVTSYRTLRLLEEVGFPRRYWGIGWTNFLHRPAIRFLAMARTREALGAFLRYRDSDLFNDALGRAQVAAIAIQPAHDLQSVPPHVSLCQAVEQSLWRLVEEASSLDESRFDDFTHEFRFVGELLSRLAVVQSDSRLQEMLAKLTELPQKLQLNRRQRLAEEVSKLIGRVCKSLSPSAFFECLNVLLQFPVNGDAVLGELPDHARWNDPLVVLQQMPDVARHSIPTPVPERISELIARVRDGSDQVRRAASLRLLYLLEAGVLSKSDQDSWADALFSKVDDAFGFPMNSGCLDGVILGLPKRPGCNETQMFRDKYLRAESAGSRDYNYFWTLVGTCRESSRSKSRTVRWTRRDLDNLIQQASDEIAPLHTRLFAYGDPDRLPPIQRGFVDPSPLVRETTTAVCEMLEKCVIRSPRASDAQKQRVAEIARRGFELRLPTLRLFPALMSVDSSLLLTLERELIFGLGSPDEQTFLDAIRAMVSWLDKLGNDGVPDPSENLLLIIASRLSTNDGSTLTTALRVCARILRGVSSGRLGEFIKRVTVATELLLPEVDYSRQESDRPWSPPSRLAFADLPDIRAGIATVISALSSIGPISQTLSDWLAKAREDCLPEIRRAANHDD